MFRFCRVVPADYTMGLSLLFTPALHSSLLPFTSIHVTPCRRVNDSWGLFLATTRQLQAPAGATMEPLGDRQGPCRRPAYQTLAVIWLLGMKIPG